MANNQIAKIWEHSDKKYTSISGKEGYQEWYHYWVVFDHNMQPYYYLAIAVLLIVWPVERVDTKFTLLSIACYAVIISYEFALYLYDGDNFRNEQNYYGYLIGFFVALLLLRRWA